MRVIRGTGIILKDHNIYCGIFSDLLFLAIKSPPYFSFPLSFLNLQLNVPIERKMKIVKSLLRYVNETSEI